MPFYSSFFFFFTDTATTEIYTLSLHDALPICIRNIGRTGPECGWPPGPRRLRKDWDSRSQFAPPGRDRKSTRLNSSHSQISYAVFCLKKKKKKNNIKTIKNTTTS